MRHWLLCGCCGILGLLVVIQVFAPATGLAYQLDVSPTPFYDPPGCVEPPNDYTRGWVNGALLTARTLAMLDHAQTLYAANGGTLVDFHLALTQGSYSTGVSASFGTHDGGGAVDLSVRSPLNWAVLDSEIDPMIRALRTAGFAAWLRAENELYAGSPIHIHAVAIGDAELSPAARAQIDGRFGYLRGYDGLPQVDGIPHPDVYGGPTLCAWMIVQGFSDLRGAPNPLPTPGGTAMPMTPLP